MNSYLLTVVIKPSVEEKERKELLESLIKRFGKLTKEDIWGSRDLSYPILHLTKAFFAHFEFDSEPKTIFDLDKSLKLNEDVLRYLLIRK